jgi:acyl-CoA hydrolase
MKRAADLGTRPDERSGGEVHLDEWISPEIADEHGDVRAGKILEWMDVVGVLAATRHCRHMVVTASVDGMELSHSIRVGERVAMTASVAYTSPRSIGVSVSMNFHGTLYGGTLMRWIESCAQLSARAYLQGAPVRLAGLHGLTFIRPVEQNVFVHIRSIIVHTAEASLTALVTVDAEDPLAGTRAETLRAFLTYEPVPKVRAERLEVAPLECAREEETALFKEVEHRLALQRTILGP